MLLNDEGRVQRKIFSNARQADGLMSNEFWFSFDNVLEED